MLLATGTAATATRGNRRARQKRGLARIWGRLVQQVDEGQQLFGCKEAAQV